MSLGNSGKIKGFCFARCHRFHFSIKAFEKDGGVSFDLLQILPPWVGLMCPPRGLGWFLLRSVKFSNDVLPRNLGYAPFHPILLEILVILSLHQGEHVCGRVSSIGRESHTHQMGRTTISRRFWLGPSFRASSPPLTDLYFWGKVVFGHRKKK